MTVSLRFVIGGFTAFIVLIVASLTLAITYSVSISAVRDAGKQLAEAISTGVAREVRGYMKQAEDHVITFQKLSKIDGSMIPSDDPLFASGEEWGDMWRYAIRAMATEVNFTYSSLSVIFDDGSIVAGLDHQSARGWYIEGVQSNRYYPNGTGYRTLQQVGFNVRTKSSGTSPRRASRRAPFSTNPPTTAATRRC